ncbi:MAG TPA: helix-turn-helix transcriptional regulator [Thermoleophilaceae bacterium]
MDPTQELVSAVGDAVRALRKERGLSQLGLSRLCKPHYNYIGGIERGERHPTLQALASIAVALEVEPIEIYRRADRVLRKAAEGDSPAAP